MTNLKSLLLASALSFGATTAAISADFPVKAVPAYAATAAAFNWTGFWVGAQVGGGFGAQPINLGAVGLAGVPGLSNLGQAGSIGQNSSGFFAGPHVEALWQIPSTKVVLGLGADWNYSTLGNAGSTSSPATVGPVIVGTNTSTGSSKLNWDASLYAKAGLTFGSQNQVLLYGLAGLGLGQVSDATSTTVPITGSVIANAVNNTHTGWTAGLGAAWHLGDGWAIKGEWRYVDLGSTSFTAASGVTALPTVTLITTPNSQMQYNKFLLGISKQL